MRKIRIFVAAMMFATLPAGCGPAEAPVPTGTPTYQQCVTEDQDGWCVWEGKLRYWDSRSENEKSWDVDTATDR